MRSEKEIREALDRIKEQIPMIYVFADIDKIDVTVAVLEWVLGMRGSMKEVSE